MFKANSTLKHILKTIEEQQGQFGKVIASTLAELEEEHIYLRDVSNFSDEQKKFLSAFSILTLINSAKYIRKPTI